MKIQKLTLEDSLSIDFECIAIHSSIEDYQLAYLINKHLNLKLKRTKEDLDIHNGHYKFPLFEWHDLKYQNKWNLISNYIFEEVAEIPTKQELFGEQIIQIKKQSLIPELKQIEYFLRLDQSSNYIDLLSVIKVLNSIPQIVTSYKLDLKKLKHIEHLTLE